MKKQKQKNSKIKKSKPAKKYHGRKVKKTVKEAVDTGIDATDQGQQEMVSSPELLDIEPWPEKVEGDGMMNAVIAIIGRHMVMTMAEQLTVALWIIYAYVCDLWRYSPFLGFQSPTIRCGKSTSLGVVASLAPKPMPMAHVSGPSIYRMIEEYSPTVLIDELDRIIHRNRDLHSVLNTAHSALAASTWVRPACLRAARSFLRNA